MMLSLQFDPFAPLYSELKFASNKKTFKKYFFEFNRTMLAYRKESKASLSVSLSVCLCVCVSVCLSVCIFVCVSGVMRLADNFTF